MKERKDICRIIKILNIHDGNCDTVYLYDLIFDFCKRHKTTPSKNTYVLDNGILIINGIYIDRVSPLAPPFDSYAKHVPWHDYAPEEANYYEDLCIYNYD